jgi:hypothetical protein
MPVIAARSPADAFDCAIEAVRIAVQYMTPVMLLTDGYIANAAEPWLVPDMDSYAPFPVTYLEEVPEGGFLPYARDEKLARPWVKPGTPGLLHRIGGIEKQLGTGNIEYGAANHQAMTEIRRDKVLGIAKVPDQEVELGNGERQAGRRRLGLDLRPDPSGGAPCARQGPRRQPHPYPPHLAAAGKSRRRFSRVTRRSSCPR